MPKNKFQEVVFTVIMVFFMVYSMICYNIRLNVGEMTNSIFLSAFHELIIMGPIAFVLDYCRLAADNFYELPGSIFLAADLRRPDRTLHLQTYFP